MFVSRDGVVIVVVAAVSFEVDGFEAVEARQIAAAAAAAAPVLGKCHVAGRFSFVPFRCCWD